MNAYNAALASINQGKKRRQQEIPTYRKVSILVDKVASILKLNCQIVMQSYQYNLLTAMYDKMQLWFLHLRILQQLWLRFPRLRLVQQLWLRFWRFRLVQQLWLWF
jgi:hypothetical protein